jgi:phosphoribosylaminoimidazolecarboxamide formyltransferase/IMP cyclohydrolase
VSFDDAVENIDIGGPSMLRSAAKNHEFVLPVVDPTDYPGVLDLLRRDGLTTEIRRGFAAKVFAHTSDYDAAIAAYLTPHEDGLPQRLGVAMERTQTLRYGENPGQRAALYVTEEPRGVRDLTQRQGKELSFNNLLDLDGAMWAVANWSTRPACAIIKHTTPCGIAVAGSAVEAFRKARATDPVSAFGSVVAFNTVVDRATAVAMSDLFVEVVVAPSFHDDALAVFAAKKALRVVELPVSRGTGSLDYKRVRGGFLVQDQFQFEPSDHDWTVATDRQPTEREWNDLRFAWAAVAPVKSNAILLARDEAAIGIGAGQMSRVDSAFLAVHKAREAGHDPAGSVLASDAFFPFTDGVEQAAAAGVTAIIQPGGSVRDAEVVEAANRHGIAMVMTGRRQFRH